MCGDATILDRVCVAIVGTRRSTPYAERVTFELAQVLARAGACIVSGLARGVDATAHRGALAVQGATCAVLGTGIDVVYPREHEALQHEIAAKGLLVSELPPSLPSHKGSFPKRNRIIAALSRVTIVVEAGVKSGALITAHHALELNRGVAAVPGPIDMPQSEGSNQLIRDGAVPITSMADALLLAGLTQPIRPSRLVENSAERRMWDVLGEGPANIDTLSTRSQLPAAQAMAAISALEIAGFVECALSGEIRRA
jgi:DNA processing protein